MRQPSSHSWFGFLSKLNRSRTVAASPRSAAFMRGEGFETLSSQPAVTTHASTKAAPVPATLMFRSSHAYPAASQPTTSPQVSLRAIGARPNFM